MQKPDSNNWGIDRTPVSLRVAEHLNRIRVLMQPREFVTVQNTEQCPRVCLCSHSMQAGIKFSSAVVLLPPAGQEHSVYFIRNIVKMTNLITILSVEECNCIKLSGGLYCQMVVSKVLKSEYLCG